MEERRRATRIRAVAFDAVGTLIYPRPSVAEAYAAVGGRFGAPLDPRTADERFVAAFDRQERLDRAQHGLQTSQARERERWQAIVAEVLPELPEKSEPFERLWTHFARPEHWAVFDDVVECWHSLKRLGLQLIIASNFDERLHAVSRALDPLSTADRVFDSATLGWRKPAAPFFRQIERALGLRPEDVLLVGDDFENDYLAAQAAGWQAVLVDRQRRQAGALGDLTQLPGLLV